MDNKSSSPLPPLQRSSVWKFKPLRVVLLGTADKGSILARLPKGDGVLSIVLGPVVVYYQLQAYGLDLHQGAEKGTLTQSQMELVTCFAPDRVQEGKGYRKRTPLHYAARDGHSESVQLLLTAKANANAADSYKYTPLHHAAMNGHSEAVQLLLTAKANPNAENLCKSAPLHNAAANGHSESAQLLLTAKANANAADSNAKTPLQCAEQYGHSDCVELLGK